MSNRISTETFVDKYMETYAEDGTFKDLANKLGVNPNSMATRRRFLVKKGVNLPNLKDSVRTRYTQDYIDQLNARVDKALRILGGR